MQLQYFDSNKQQNQDDLGLELSELEFQVEQCDTEHSEVDLPEVEIESPRLRKVELWTGRLAMFGVTSLLITIAINAV